VLFILLLRLLYKQLCFLHQEKIWMSGSTEEAVEFFKIPSTAELCFPNITYEDVEPLFIQASKRLYHERVYAKVWTYYVPQKRLQ
jgi:hypothetical protein